MLKLKGRDQQLATAALSRMLAEGTLERAGFGWYRFVPGRPS